MPLSFDSNGPVRFASRALAACLALAGLTLAAPAQEICLTAVFDGGQEVPANGSPGRGTAVFRMDPAANTIDYQMTFEGLTAAETAAHIHGFAAPGSNAGLLVTLPPGAHKTGVWNYAEADEANILAGLTYVNIHSTAFTAGEIRGQITRDVNGATLVADIDGAQSGTGSPAVGTGWFSMDRVANTLDYHITFTASSLLGSETVAHIHGFASPGSNAGVKHSLPAGFHKSGTWNFTEADELGILSEMAYVNIHSSAFPGGEIRGQMTVECLCNTQFTSYCTAGTSASGCNATLSAVGIPSATLPSGFTLMASGVEGQKDGLFFFGVNGQQANAWGNGTSFQCVVPPVARAGLLTGVGTVGACDGAVSQDLNARWTAKPGTRPALGDIVDAQLWYRDPFNTSNQTTSLSDGLSFLVCP